jgi:sugar porter (SP) family MFS transporter
MMFTLLKKALHMPLYQRASIITAIGGFLFGLDTGTIGPVTTMKSFLSTFGHLSSTLHGIVVSSILIGGTLSGIFAGNIADIYGRVPTIVAGAAIFGVGATVECAAPKLVVFITGRIITGIGEGLFLGTLVVYVCEIAPARRRGPLASLIQFLVTIGLATGYFVAYGTAKIQSSAAAWRIPLGFQAMVAFCFALACLRLPPSPRWLLAKHKTDQALLTLEQLGLESSELEQMASYGSHDAIHADTSLWGSIRSNYNDMTRVFSKAARKQTGLACFLMAMQQFSGIDGVLFYAPLLFQQAGLASGQASFLASGVSALVIFSVTIPASIYADRMGRRASTILGGLAMVAVMLLVGSLYASQTVHGDRGLARWVVIVCIYIFAIAFSITWAISLRIYSSEIQPAATRASATSLAQSANWVSLFLPLFVLR